MAKKTLAKTEKAIKRAAMANAAMFQFQKNKASGHQFLPEFYARRREILFRGVLLITYGRIRFEISGLLPNFMHGNIFIEARSKKSVNPTIPYTPLLHIL